jgi:hypothetical protein
MIITAATAVTPKTTTLPTPSMSTAATSVTAPTITTLNQSLATLSQDIFASKADIVNKSIEIGRRYKGPMFNPNTKYNKKSVLSTTSYSLPYPSSSTISKKRERTIDAKETASIDTSKEKKVKCDYVGTCTFTIS